MASSNSSCAVSSSPPTECKFCNTMHEQNEREGDGKMQPIDDRRVRGIKALIQPQFLCEKLPVNSTIAAQIRLHRTEISDIIHHLDHRLLVVVGPCSIHDPKAAVEYGRKLKEFADTVQEDMKIIMRVYFEKPRTTVGWKGLINDPFLDGSFQINKGLRVARGLLLELNEIGLACGCEFLDTITPQYISDLVSWGAIGARTTESQVHRELASGLSMPIGFKNSTDGGVGIAVDAIKTVIQGHHFLGINKQGLASIIHTTGNRDCHVILRGGSRGPNYSSADVLETSERMVNGGLTPTIMVDCSHDNSRKLHKNQIVVIEDIAQQLREISTKEHSKWIIGVMLESNLHEGKQLLDSKNLSTLKYGVSITDACLGWEDTVKTLTTLCEAARFRRNFLEKSKSDR